MPLSKARNRERMRRYRLHVQPDEAPVVRPVVGSWRDPEITGAGDVRPYDPTRRYKPGERVLIQQGRGWVETVIPELDGEGNPIYEEW